MIVDVPILNEDGTIKLTVTLDDRQLKAVLQFGLNFLVAAGLAASYGVEIEDTTPSMDGSGPEQGELFN